MGGVSPAAEQAELTLSPVKSLGGATWGTHTGASLCFDSLGDPTATPHYALTGLHESLVFNCVVLYC